MSTAASPHGHTITHERPEDLVSPATILGYLFDAIMTFIQAVICTVEVLIIYMLPILLLLGIFPFLFVCGLLVMVLGSILHAFLPG